MDDQSRAIEALLHEMDVRGGLFDSCAKIASPDGGPAIVKAIVRNWNSPFGISVMTAVFAVVARQKNLIFNVTFEDCLFAGQDDQRLLTRIIPNRQTNIRRKEPWNDTMTPAALSETLRPT